MIVDLTILIIIGCVLEGLATKMTGYVINGAPTFTFSLLIVFIAIARWNLWGYIVIPFVALATWLGGHFNGLPAMSAVYDWRIFVSSMLGLLTLGINVIFYKKYKTANVLHSTIKLLGLVLLNYATYSLVQFISYRLMCSGNLLQVGQNLLTYTYIDSSSKKEIVETVNVFAYGENGIVYNLFGLAVCTVGLIALRSQGVVNNVVDKLVADKKDADFIQNNTENFEIKESDEKEETANKDNPDEKD